jgi:ankyrin repeat protein
VGALEALAAPGKTPPSAGGSGTSLDTKMNSSGEQLLLAAKNGDIGALRAALADGADTLDSALVTAAGEGHGLAATYLIDSGADLQVLDYWPARRAAEGGHLDTLRLLLDRAGDNAPDMAQVVLSEAASHGHEELVRWLLDEGHANPAGAADTPLKRAALKGHLSVAELLLERGKASPEQLNNALGQAAKSDTATVARLLISRGATLDALDPVLQSLAERLLAKEPPSADIGEDE